MTARRTLHDTNEISRKRADVSKSRRQLTNAAGSERTGRRVKSQARLVNEIKTEDVVGAG